MKLSSTQQNVLNLMASGWQLGTSVAIDSRAWLQRGGCGRGVESQDVRSCTVTALRQRGLIEVDHRRFPLETWRLTKAGLAAAEGGTDGD